MDTASAAFLAPDEHSRKVNLWRVMLTDSQTTTHKGKLSLFLPTSYVQSSGPPELQRSLHNWQQVLITFSLNIFCLIGLKWCRMAFTPKIFVTLPGGQCCAFSTTSRSSSSGTYAFPGELPSLLQDASYYSYSNESGPHLPSLFPSHCHSLQQNVFESPSESSNFYFINETELQKGLCAFS